VRPRGASGIAIMSRCTTCATYHNRMLTYRGECHDDHLASFSCGLSSANSESPGTQSALTTQVGPRSADEGLCF
jgi:hypothetical protein